VRIASFHRDLLAAFGARATPLDDALAATTA
jgi:hypothetical protein